MLIAVSHKARKLLKNQILVVLDTVILDIRFIPLNFKHVLDMPVLSL